MDNRVFVSFPWWWGNELDSGRSSVVLICRRNNSGSTFSFVWWVSKYTSKYTDGCSQSWLVAGLCCRWISRRWRREEQTATLTLELGSWSTVKETAEKRQKNKLRYWAVTQTPCSVPILFICPCPQTGYAQCAQFLSEHIMILSFIWPGTSQLL